MSDTRKCNLYDLGTIWQTCIRINLQLRVVRKFGYKIYAYIYISYYLNSTNGLINEVTGLNVLEFRLEKFEFTYLDFFLYFTRKSKVP